jgi:hypothetical protein
MPRQIITIEDFSGGEYGLEAAFRGAPNQFTGTNVVRYVDGSLGPRNGLKRITTSGAAMLGEVKGWGQNDLARVAGNKPHWLIVGTTAVFLMNDSGLVATSGSIAVTPAEPPTFIQKAQLSYISVINDKLYKVDHTAATTTAIASPNSPGLRSIVQYGERTMAAGPNGKAPDGSAAPQNRLYFSAAGNPESWPAANFIDVGDSNIAITALVPQRTHLAIITSDGAWWILTGVPGVNPVLRRQLASVSPAFPHHVTALGNGNLGYTIASTPNGSTPSLGQFSGSAIDLHPRIAFGNGRLSGPLPSYTAVPLKNVNDWFIMGGSAVAPNQLALQKDGTWTLHQFQVAGVTLYGFAISETVGDTHRFTDGGSVGVTPKFYSWRAYNNRPTFTSDGSTQPGDDSTTPFTASFTLPEWTAPSGQEVAVVEVAVDFITYATGSPATTHFDLTPTITRIFNGGSRTLSALSWDETTDAGGVASTTGGIQRRKRFSFGQPQEGGGFTLQFSNLRGVAIQRVHVHIETDGERF